MIKYLGSKRLLVPVLGRIAAACGARTALDLFTGTTRVAQEFKRRGLEVTAVDVATYAEVLSRCYIGTDADTVNRDELAEAIARLNRLPGRRGYVTRTFCEQARYFRPENGRRIDAVRDAVEDHAGTSLHPVLLTALLLAADRVDSTTGLQMAFLKQWSPRSAQPLTLVEPILLPGPGHAVLGDATTVVDVLPPVDLAYLDPPYNQHRYFTNYHVWETLVRRDEPEHYGIARKRIDAREQATKSVFNYRATMPDAVRSVIARTRARLVVASYNDESWMTPDEISTALADAGHETVAVLGFDSRRYVGARIGIHNPLGERVGKVGHLRNTEYLFVAGPRDLVEACVAAADVAS
ncbi:MAG: DNA adenine methylase [Actinomycetota bacterium]|nr:DNA adenine methylase [Actinomycetota bacterium]